MGTTDDSEAVTASEIMCNQIRDAHKVVGEGAVAPCDGGEMVPELFHLWLSTIPAVCEQALWLSANEDRELDRASACKALAEPLGPAFYAVHMAQYMQSLVAQDATFMHATEESVADSPIRGWNLVDFLNCEAERVSQPCTTWNDAFERGAIECPTEILDDDCTRPNVIQMIECKVESVQAMVESYAPVTTEPRITMMELAPRFVECSGEIADFYGHRGDVEKLTKEADDELVLDLAITNSVTNPALIWILETLATELFFEPAGTGDLEPPHDYHYNWECSGYGGGYATGQGGFARRVYWEVDAEPCYYDGIVVIECTQPLLGGTAIGGSERGKAPWELCNPVWGTYQDICIETPNHVQACGNGNLRAFNVPTVVGPTTSGSLSEFYPCPAGAHWIDYVMVDPADFD